MLGHPIILTHQSNYLEARGFWSRRTSEVTHLSVHWDLLRKKLPGNGDEFLSPLPFLQFCDPASTNSLSSEPCSP